MAESPKYTLFEIAAGTGMLGHGLAVALDTLGVRTDVVGGCEWDSCAAAAFLAGLEIETGRRPPVWDDARTFAPRKFRHRGTGGLVDIVCAGYPCQPFSHAGRRAGATDARHLWPACRRIVARLQPSIVFFENVDGHVTMGLWKVLRDCERLGYRTTAGVYSAEEVGSPNLRKRVFTLGFRDCKGRQPAGIPDEWHQVPSGARAALANGPSNGHATSGREQGRDDAVQRGSELGIAECAKPWAGDGSEQINPQVGGCGRADAGEELADGIGEGPQGSPESGEQGSLNWATGRGRPIFPPGRGVDPKELAARLAKADGEAACRQATLDAGRVSVRVFSDWRDIAAGLGADFMPAVESGVSVVADGMASSADLLRLGGNGVNPLQAAWAFLNLFACLMDEVETPDDFSPLFDGADCEPDTKQLTLFKTG